MSDALTEVLLAALLDVVASLELSADDLVDPGFVADTSTTSPANWTPSLTPTGRCSSP